MPPVTKAEDQPVLVATADYPYAKWKFEKFNPVQSRCMDFFDKEVNGLIAAMTSGGKTVVAEMFLAQEIRKRGGKGMFLAPLRALGREKYVDWKNESYHFADLKTSICTGDYRLTKDRAKELSEADLIIMTSEMLNHRSRNYKSEQNNWLKKVGTLVIDECLPPTALVETDKGQLSIGQIIDQHLDVRVMSFNHNTQTVEYKKIVARQKKLLKRKWHTLYYEGGYISVTANHLVWCDGRGYIPSKDVQQGDIIYVRRIDGERKASDSRDIVGGWVDSLPASRQISEGSCTTVGQTKGFSRMEVQRVEATGWHAAASEAKQRIWERNLSIQHTIEQGVVGNTRDLLSKQENCESSLVRGNQQSSCVGGMVYGRREPRAKYDVNSYRRVFQSRSFIAGRLASRKVVGEMHAVSNQEVLGVEIPIRGAGQVSGFDPHRDYSRYGIQGVAKNGTNILFNVRQGVYSRPAKSTYSSQSFALRSEGMSSKMGQDVQQDNGMDSEESWCCDLEIEDNNNFFVNGILVHNSHLLTVPGRGDHLEVGLMKFTELNPKARLVLLSATMPNVEEIADWVSYSLTKRDTFLIKSKYRPVPLTVHYEVYDDSVNKYDVLEEEKVSKAVELVDHYSDDKFLIFAHTKRTGELMKAALRTIGVEAQFHNADLDADDRAKVEDRFRNDPKLRVIVATSTLAWGLNLPARRVIILGVHRGLAEVESHDIIQMVGRSGRLGIDPMGDAYILIPETRKGEFKQKLSKPTRIESQLLEKLGEKYKTLAFHLVSEIHHGHVETTDDVHEWYKRSLAYFQNKALEETVIDSTLEMLEKCGAISNVNEKWTARPIGKISSLFYFSPFDVSGLYYNFKNLFEQQQEDDEYALSMALGNIDTFQQGIVSRVEREEMSMYAGQIRRKMVGKFMTEASIKAGFCYFNLLNGINAQACAAVQRNIQFDFNRVSQVLQALDGFTGKWDQAGFFKALESRITNGIPGHLIDVCRLPNIGKVRAHKLYNAGFKTVEEIADANPEQIRKILNYKQDALDKLMKDAKIIALT